MRGRSGIERRPPIKDQRQRPTEPDVKIFLLEYRGKNGRFIFYASNRRMNESAPFIAATRENIRPRFRRHPHTQRSGPSSRLSCIGGVGG